MNRPLQRAGRLTGLLALVLTLQACGGAPDERAAATTSPRSGQTAAPADPASPPGGEQTDAGGEASPFSSRDRLRVKTLAGERRLVDADSRPILLRGASVNALVDYGTTHTAPVAVRARDLRQMAALGFNVMRLAVSWSKLMPEPGKLDRRYLKEITTLVRRAGRARIYTVISMHSDRYAADLGSGTEFDGAPKWAVATDGLPCGDPRPRYYTPCAAAAARHFYRGDSVDGRTGLAWYTDAVIAVARAGRAGGPGYAGTDILNEPTDPDATPDAAATPQWARALHRLQRSIVARLRAGGERAPIWIQPQGPRSVGAKTRAVLPRLDDDALVYAPHAYIDVYDGGPNAGTAERMAQQYRAFEKEAASLRAATVVGEFPGAVGPGWEELRAEHLTRQRRAGFGGIAWLWKQPADGYGWGTLAPDGSLRADTNAAQVLSAPRLIAGSGAVRVEADGSGAVSVRSSGGAAQTVDVWLGAALDPGAKPTRTYRLEPGSGTRIALETSWSSTAVLGDTKIGGTTIRLRLPQGRAAASLVPAG